MQGIHPGQEDHLIEIQSVGVSAPAPQIMLAPAPQIIQEQSSDAPAQRDPTPIYYLLIPAAAGLEQVLDSKRYNEIIITRATVPVGEDIGFLPGTEEEKMQPWMGAFDDNLEVLHRNEDNAGEWGRATLLRGQDVLAPLLPLRPGCPKR